MITQIIKRDGRKEIFDQSKILAAVEKAQHVTKENVRIGLVTDKVIEEIEKKFSDTNLPTVEQVQDIVVDVLMDMGYKKTVEEYIGYRARRSQIREAKSRLMTSIKNITFQDSKDNDTKRENANVDGDSPMGTMLKYGSETSKDFYLNNMIDPMIAQAHRDGYIHIHDLDFYALTLTCCQIDLLKLFKNGFSTGHGYVREPNDIRTYAALACIAIQANQNDMHGGQAVPNFDYSMAPGVKKSYNKIFRNNCIKFADFLIQPEVSYSEKLKPLFADLIANDKQPRYLNEESIENTFKLLKEKFPEVDWDRCRKDIVKDSNKEIEDQTYQAMEALIHNLNTMHSRAGAQVPFSSLNYGTDTSPEGRLVIKMILKATEAGLGDGETPIFPIQIFKVKDGVSYNKEDPNYDLLVEAMICSSKRLFPNFSFLDAPFNKRDYKPGDYDQEVAYMGCRTRVFENYVHPDKAVTCGRGNLSFTSINLPRLAIEADHDIDVFFDKLHTVLDLVTKQLLDRFEIQRHRKVYNMPFLMGNGVWLGSDKLKRTDDISSVIDEGTLTYGFIGLAEALVALVGKHHGESKESQQLGLKIVKYMSDYAKEQTKKYNHNFGVIATPAEGLSGRFVKMDQKRYGCIKGVTDREFYTNSMHVPVYYPISMFDKIDIEAQYHPYTLAGHITYIEMDGDTAKNIKAFENVVRHMHDAGIGYGAINHPVDRDPVCGFNGIIDDECPKCHRHEDDGSGVSFERIRRITGYLVGTLDRFNNGKRAEEKARVKHSLYSKKEELE